MTESISRDRHRVASYQTVIPAGALSWLDAEGEWSLMAVGPPKLRAHRCRHTTNTGLQKQVSRRSPLWQLPDRLLCHQSVARHHIPRHSDARAVRSVRDDQPPLPLSALCHGAHSIVVAARVTHHFRSKSGDRLLASRSHRLGDIDDTAAAKGVRPQATDLPWLPSVAAQTVIPPALSRCAPSSSSLLLGISPVRSATLLATARNTA